MTMISYAQNFEDVMLYRALKDVQKGFYIDIGAQHPVYDSVTNVFYQMGWRGVNVEPVREYYRLLVEKRSDDINLNCAVGNICGEGDFFSSPVSGMSSLRGEAVSLMCNSGYAFNKTKVPIFTLDYIFGTHSFPSEIHFLKIDVEGAEKEVLEGWTNPDFRPWIVVIEATAPNTQKFVFEAWEPLLLEKGYRKVYCDGLNNYYLAHGQSDRARYFKLAPNFFDSFERYQVVELRNSLSAAQDAIIRCQESINRSKEAINRLNEIIAEKDARLEAIPRVIRAFFWKIRKNVFPSK